MMMDKWTDRLSEYMDGDLTSDEAEALEAHLLECADCGRTLRDLRAVVARAGQVVDRPPVNDLWQGIAAQIAVTEQGVVEQQSSKRRLSFSIPQLAAASVALMVMSAGTMYLMTSGRQDAPVATTTVEQPVQSPAVTNVGARAAGNYSAAIDELESALKDGRTQLDSSTVRVLETNLRAIDVAIADARQALSRDPDNQYLNRYLDQTMQRKVQLLRRATGILRAQT